MEELKGGRKGMIYKQGDVVFRPVNPWSSTIHRLLAHLHQQGFKACPEFLGVENNQEILRFIDGDTFNYPLSGAIASEEALTSASEMLRQLHDCSANFLVSHSHEDLTWMLPPRLPYEVICHGDFAPYNVALNGNQVVGVFDFDTAHPAPRLWDIAYAVYCWAPFKTNPYDKLGEIEDQAKRAAIFCDAYRLDSNQKSMLVDAMIERVQALVDFITSEADAGNEAFIQNIADGHHLGYLDDIAYMSKHTAFITSVLTST